MQSDNDCRLGLTALLSALLVAFTIEFDNAFEDRLPHRTTRHGRTAGPGPRPWLVSMAFWVHCMRFVPEEGLSVVDLVRRSQLTPKSTQAVLRRLGQWWGYLDLSPGPADRRAKAAASQRLIRPTKAGQKAQSIWTPLTDEIEQRWNDRFGCGAVDDLRSALSEVVACLHVDPPDYLPLGEPRLPSRPPGQGVPGLPLTALLSKVLLALALDFDDHSDLSVGVYTSGVAARLPICADVLRLIGEDGVAAAQIPGLSGVAKISIDNWVGALDRFGYLEVATEGQRRVARLSPKGARARDTYLEWTASLEGRWPAAGSSAMLGRLRRAAADLVGVPGQGSPLWKGMEPPTGGWRRREAPRQVLPHFPFVTHRGGFPDGA